LTQAARPDQELTRLLAEGVTGCLSAVGVAGGGLRLYLMSGEVLAAHADEDDELLLRRLIARGNLGPGEAAQLRAAGDEALSEALFSVVDEDALLEVLFDRFRENIADFLGATAPTIFEPLDAIFVPNLQVAHDTAELLAELRALLLRTEHLRTDEGQRVTLQVGSEGPRHPSETALVELIGRRLGLDELLRESPYELLETLDIVIDMLEAGVVAELVPEPVSPEAAPTDVIAPDEPDPADVLDRAGFTSGPDADVHDEELAFFSDHDVRRGGGEDGHFVKTQAELNAEAVDLRDVIPADVGLVSPDEPIEAAEASGPDLGDAPLAKVAMNFTGPRLSNAEAYKKIGVVNEVLGQMACAYDAQSGNGSGEASIQLLLDGAPSEFAILFHQVAAADDGTLSPNAILHNLRRRPAPEHRRLLNRGLGDLIERSLSAACEELEDEAIDGLLEAIAGYQQRLGF